MRFAESQAVAFHRRLRIRRDRGREPRRVPPGRRAGPSRRRCPVSAPSVLAGDAASSAATPRGCCGVDATRRTPRPRRPARRCSWPFAPLGTLRLTRSPRWYGPTAAPDRRALRGLPLARQAAVTHLRPDAAPRRRVGPWWRPEATSETWIELAWQDGSLGWIGIANLPSAAACAAYLPDEGFEEVFTGGGNQVTAGGQFIAGVAGEGGYRAGRTRRRLGPPRTRGRHAHRRRDW